MNPEIILSDKINITNIKRIAAWAADNRENKEKLWSFVHSSDRRTSVNALWAMTHLPASESDWLFTLRDEMIDMLMSETDPGKKRMLLQILRDQDYEPEHIRTDFLDFCMSKINAECEPYAVRCFCIYTAFKMCVHYPELISEFEQHLDMMLFQPLSPGLESALRQTKTKISKL